MEKQNYPDLKYVIIQVNHVESLLKSTVVIKCINIQINQNSKHMN